MNVQQISDSASEVVEIEPPSESSLTYHSSNTIENTDNAIIATHVVTNGENPPTMNESLRRLSRLSYLPYRLRYLIRVFNLSTSFDDVSIVRTKHSV